MNNSMKSMRLLLVLSVLCLGIGNGIAQYRWEKVKAGDKSPDFSYEDINGKRYSLKDFKGKYLLIDMWASYCGPCQAEIPHWKKIMKEFKGKKISFVTISIDYSREEWEAKLKEENMDGIHLLVDRENGLEFVGKYRVETIPRYILIDQEGKVVNPDMPRPSDPEMLKVLKALENL